jgi:PAS domain S-box-containing protein
LHGYVAIPLVSSVVSAAMAGAILARDARHPANRLAALLIGGASWWAGCEVLWNTAADPALALRFVRLSALGWAALGPLTLHLFVEIAGDPAPRARRALPWLYAGAAGFAAAALAGWIHPAVAREAWGWSYALAPLYLAFYVFTVVCMSMGLRVLLRAARHAVSTTERDQMRLLLVGLMIPLCVASATDGLLPSAGIQLPRLGTAAFAVLNGILAWTFHRYTYPIVAPGGFGREILHALRDGVALLRLDGAIRAANAGLGRLVGCDVSELEGRQVAELIPGPPLRFEAPVNERECELVAASGRRIPVSISTAPLHDRPSKALGLVLSVRDLREVVTLRNRLVVSGRLAAVGELAAGIAHEINNPIAYVRANLGQLRLAWQALARQLEAAGDAAWSERAREGLEMIDESLEGVDRAAAIVRDVKGFSHAGSERELVDLNRLLLSVLRVASPQLRYRAHVETLLAEVPLVPGSAQELKQVFLNLLLNAGHAVRDGGRIRLSTVEVAGDVYVIVEDDGCGMSADLLARIFDPFFTTRQVGDGTGLGLAIAWQIVRNHGGEISVESEPGRGTLVRVQLPGVHAAPD